MKPCWPSTENAEQLAERLEKLDKAITSPGENAILLAAARKLREQALSLSEEQRVTELWRKAWREEDAFGAEAMGKLAAVMPPLHPQGAMYSPTGMLEAIDLLIARGSYAERIASAGYTLTQRLVAIGTVDSTLKGEELIRRDSVMEFVTRWRMDVDAAGANKALQMSATIGSVGQSNDPLTIERAIAYCKGQAMHFPDCAADRAYDKGVAACVRILEDMLPMQSEAPATSAARRSEGYMLVPITPTDAMVEAAAKLQMDRIRAMGANNKGAVQGIKDQWRVMVHAAPDVGTESHAQGATLESKP